MNDQEFVDAHLPLIHSIATRLHKALELRVEIKDLISFGCQGLLEARQRFDAARGVRFKTFAYYRIRGAIMDGIRQMAYLPRRAYAKLRLAERLDQESETLLADRGGTIPPGPAGRPQAMEALHAITMRLSAAAVIAAVGQDQDDHPHTEDPETHALEDEREVRVRQALAALSGRERQLLQGVYFEHRRFDDVAAEIGISKSWASRLHGRALEQLRAQLEDMAPG